MQMRDLRAHAAGLGLTVQLEDLGARNGEVRAGGRIVVNDDRSLSVQREVLAHEIGHFVLGHNWTGAHDVVRDERLADTYAARLLITPERYALAEHLVGTNSGALAYELQVSVRLIDLWRTSYRRDQYKTARRRARVAV